MKKSLFLIGLLLSFISFSACSSSDDKISSPIVGTWITSDVMETSEITFNSNGTATENRTLKRNGAMREYVGTYGVVNNKLTINWKKYRDFNSVSREWSNYTNDEETVIITFSIKDDMLIFLSMDGEKEQNPIYHTRKK
ncbi:hypothetical protein [Bacteroides pyogenes]|uniref:hypothetical protein n=1 Tax=Bacteroides pyogenes TaxID=310300 RepID=UPI001BAD51A6|nr:hypothetical protein [Bacteroides pyogenes]